MQRWFSGKRIHEDPIGSFKLLTDRQTDKCRVKKNLLGGNNQSVKTTTRNYVTGGIIRKPYGTRTFLARRWLRRRTDDRGP